MWIYWWTERVRIINCCWSQSLFYVVIQKPMEILLAFSRINQSFGLNYKNMPSLQHSISIMPQMQLIKFNLYWTPNIPFNKWSEKCWEQIFGNPARHPVGGGASGSEQPKLVKTLPRFFNFYPWSLQYRERSGGMSSFSKTKQNVRFICYENNPANLLFFSPSKTSVDSQGCAQLVIGQAS